MTHAPGSTDRPPDRRPDLRWRIGLAGLTLVAFALRAYRLAGQCLWSDEDITLDRAGLPLRELLAGLPIEHGPLYFAVMRLWTRLAGDGDLALRFPSLACGVLAVVLAAYVAGRLIGRRAGLFLALIIAINPFQVWYGQEARMYTLVQVLALAALAAVLRAESAAAGAAFAAERNSRIAAGPSTTGRRGWTVAGPSTTGRRGWIVAGLSTAGRHWWIAAGVATALAVYSHYYGALLVFVLVAWAILDVLTRRRSAIPGWLITGFTAALLFAPGLRRALAALSFPGWREPEPLARMPWINLSAWSAGSTVITAEARPITWLYVALAAAGLLVMARQAVRQRGVRRALLFIGVPLVVSTALLLRTTDFHPRYYFGVLPAFYLAVAVGAAELPRGGRQLAAVLLVAAAAPSLANLYTDPAFQKQDYRGFLRAVESAAGHEDTVLFLDGPAYGLSRRYEAARSPVKIVNLRSSTNLQHSRAELEMQIAQLASEYPHLWLAADGTTALAWMRRVGYAELWLDAHTYLVTGVAYQHITLDRYYSPVPDPLAPELVDDYRCPDDRLDPPVDRAGSTDNSAGSLNDRAGLPNLSTGAADPDCEPTALAIAAPATVVAGEVLPLRLVWLPALPIARRYHVSVRLVAPESDRPVVAADRVPGSDARPTTSWVPGEPVPDRYGLLVAPSTTPGSYHIAVVLYDPATLAPVATWTGPGITVAAAP